MSRFEPPPLLPPVPFEVDPDAQIAELERLINDERAAIAKTKSDLVPLFGPAFFERLDSNPIFANVGSEEFIQTFVEHETPAVVLIASALMRLNENELKLEEMKRQREMLKEEKRLNSLLPSELVAMISDLRAQREVAEEELRKQNSLLEVQLTALKSKVDELENAKQSKTSTDVQASNEEFVLLMHEFKSFLPFLQMLKSEKDLEIQSLLEQREIKPDRTVHPMNFTFSHKGHKCIYPNGCGKKAPHRKSHETADERWSCCDMICSSNDPICRENPEVPSTRHVGHECIFPNGCCGDEPHRITEDDVTRWSCCDMECSLNNPICQLMRMYPCCRKMDFTISGCKYECCEELVEDGHSAECHWKPSYFLDSTDVEKMDSCAETTTITQHSHPLKKSIDKGPYKCIVCDRWSVGWMYCCDNDDCYVCVHPKCGCPSNFP